MTDSVKAWINLCRKTIDFIINNPAMPGNSVDDFIDVIKDHYEKLSEVDKLQLTLLDFINEVKKYFLQEPPPLNIKEQEIGGWLDKAQRIMPQNHWMAYKEMLIRNNKSDMIPLLESDTFEIMDSCMNPENDGEWDRRGLVYGHVQSGKTANYIGLINRALDFGYKIIIVFTGMTEDLRKQTQERINEGVIGRDDNNFRYGVGESGNIDKIHKGTTLKFDFSSSSLPIQISNLSLRSKTVFVVKKNVTILNNLIKWLRKKSEEEENNCYKISGAPFLIIDDEADNASINSISKSEADSGEYDLKSINRNLRIILSLISKKSFIAYTATPYSVVLQRSEDYERTYKIDGYTYLIDEDSDLFPEHFIIPIRAGDKYMGIERIFGNETFDGLPVICKIDEDSRFVDDVLPDGGFFTSGKDTVYDFEMIPDSLRISILHFIAAIIVRSARGHKDHNTMMIHTSHEIYKIDYLAYKVSEYLKMLINQIRSNSSILLDSISQEMNVIQKISHNSYFIKCYDGPRKLLPFTSKQEIFDVLKSIDIVSLHSKPTDPKLKHHYHDLKYGKHFKNYIVIGGNRLSRGLTIEGLSVSYFLRQSSRKDSIYQMGRWFGYRLDYEDCVMIYTHSEQFEWYKDIMLLEQKLRNDLNRMNSFEMTPSNWEINVARSSVFNSLNNRITITDPGKVRFTAIKKLDFGGISIRTKYFLRKNEVHEKNLKLVINLIHYFCDSNLHYVNGEYPKYDTNLNFVNVPYTLILTFLNKFIFHEYQVLDFKDLQSYIEKYGMNLSSFSVVVKRTKNIKYSHEYPKEIIQPVRRDDQLRGKGSYYEIDALLDEDKDNTFDIINDANIEEYKRIGAKFRYEKRNELKKAIMVIYPVYGKIENGKNEIVFPALYFAIPKIGDQDDVITRKKNGNTN